MKPLCFNELSIQPLAADFQGCYARIKRLIETYKVAKDPKKSHGFNGIRFYQTLDQIMLESNYSVRDFLADTRARTLATTLLSIYRYPFIDDNSEEERRYIQSSFFISKGGSELPVHGLAAAYLYETIGIGFGSEPFWDAIRFPLRIEGEESRNATILSVSCPAHFEHPDFTAWKLQHTPVCLVTCGIAPSCKKIHVGAHHGKDILTQFAQRLVHSPYVIEIVNSLPWQGSASNFIHAIRDNGLIEIVLVTTDKGFGLLVKTTGRNEKETAEIGRILKAQYD